MLFPAYAGVIPFCNFVVDTIVAFPRIRGGDPSFQILTYALIGFSPHMRG